LRSAPVVWASAEYERRTESVQGGTETPLADPGSSLKRLPFEQGPIVAADLFVVPYCWRFDTDPVEVIGIEDIPFLERNPTFLAPPGRSPEGPRVELDGNRRMPILGSNADGSRFRIPTERRIYLNGGDEPASDTSYLVPSATDAKGNRFEPFV